MNGDSTRDFYYNGGDQLVDLHRDPSIYSVRYKAGKRSDSPEFSADAQKLLREESVPVDFISNHGLHIYKLRDTAVAKRVDAPAGAARPRFVRTLNDEGPIAYASPVFRRTPEATNLIFVTNRFLVEFKAGVTQAQVAEVNALYHVTIVEEFNYSRPRLCYLLAAPDGDGDMGPFELAKRYFELGIAVYAIPDLVRRRYIRGGGGAPAPGGGGLHWTYEQSQWHLAKSKVVDAWQVTRGRDSVVVAVADDGIDVTHPEFAGKVYAQFDFAANVADATPKNTTDNHGTSCAGVAAAQGVQAQGAAPGCKLMAVRSPDMLGIADEARMFQWMADQGAHVISCSWGPEDGQSYATPLPGSTQSAIHYCVTSGRGGKGIPIFWAAGNGNESIVTDGYANNPEIIAVAASTINDTIAYYSDFGANIWICAPSSGRASAGELRIFTTDRGGSSGYNPGGSTQAGDQNGDYTNDFGGTSSSAPLAAGIAALVLSANGDLTAAQVRSILAETADKIGDGYDATGHSDKFGFGRVNALKAVQAAQNRATAPAITGPASSWRTGAAPTFQIDSAGQPAWAVEVATDAKLFDKVNHAAERTSSNFYASWQTSGLSSGASYTLPGEFWNALVQSRPAVKNLFYRVWTSASSSAWVNATASTANADYARAPSIAILDAASSPVITAPDSAPRTGPAPVFQITPGAQPYFAVEVATRAELFDKPNHAAERNARNFYASWQDSGLISGSSYTLPQVVWSRLVQTVPTVDRLYYRVWTSASGSGWSNPAASVANADFAKAPSIRIIDNAAVVARRNAPPGEEKQPAGPDDSQGPAIDAPQQYERNSAEPVSFRVTPGRRQLFAVEVATAPALFTDAGGDRRTASNFFASWRLELLYGSDAPDGETTYVLPPGAWQKLRAADQLYYRVLALANQSQSFANVVSSLPGEKVESAPSIQLTGRLGERLPAVVIRPEEALWRQER